MAATETRIYLCGPLVARVEGDRIEEQLPGRQGRALFAYLVLNRGRAVSRDELIDALWDEGPPHGAESSLNALVSKVRRAVGSDAIAGRSELTLRLPSGAWVDLDAADEALHRAESAAALERWTEAWSPARVTVHVTARGLLTNLEGSWLQPWRRRVEELRLRSLECYGMTCLALGGTEIPAAERSARGLIEAAPYRESGYRLLMQVHAARGNPAEGLRVYEELRRLLSEELGVDPGPATQTIHAALLGS